MAKKLCILAILIILLPLIHYAQSDAPDSFGEIMEETEISDYNFMSYHIHEEEKQQGFWHDFFFPRFNISHLFFLVFLGFLYFRNVSLRRQVLRTRGKIRSLNIKLNRRVDQLTYEQRQMEKKAPDASS